MRFAKCAELVSSRRSDVRLIVLVMLLFIDSFPVTVGTHDNRDSRKLFGGYRITPAYCKATRTAKYNRGNTICMFNHECVQRGGEVVGACMDGFLFGACCQLKSDSQSHIPKGPGVVMTSYIDYPEADPESEDYESEQLSAWHDSFKPIVTPGYRPTEKSNPTTRSTTERTVTGSTDSFSISEGLSQITNTLLHEPTKENSILVKPGRPDSEVYTHSAINHGLADTILIHTNGSEADDIVRPSDFNIHISSMQTKPTIIPSSMTSTTTTPKTVSTHLPIYTKPIFKLKPNKNKTEIYKPFKTSTEKYVPLSTASKISNKQTELSSINSIIQMLNDSTPSLMNEVTSPGLVSSETAETKSSPTPSVTAAPVSYSSGLPTYYISTGHYVTLKPQDSNTVSLHGSSSIGYSSTSKPIITSKYTTPFSTTKNKYSTPNLITKNKYLSSKPIIKVTPKPVTKIPTKTTPSKTTPKPYSSSSQTTTSQDIDAFNRYPSDPSLFSDSVTTFTHISSTTKSPSTTTRKPPSTSYVFSAKPSKRPITASPSPGPVYDIPPESFSSVTPTVIVLNGFQSTKQPATEEEPQFVEISQEPFKRPTSTITVNNNIESTNNIYMNKQPSSTSSKPGSSPTVVITPKPSPSTTGYPNRPDFQQFSTVSTDLYTEYAVSTFKPELQTSSDDLINFPPVRNPMLNATGSNSALFNTSISLSDSEFDQYDSVDFTTPVWQEDEKLNEKMNLFVNKIVGSLQGTFQELHDIVILDKKPNTTIIKAPTTTAKPTKKPATTRRPATTTRKPSRLTTTTRKPIRTTKKPVKATTQAKRTTTPAPTTTRRSVTTTKKSKPTKKVQTTTAATTTATEAEEATTEAIYSDESVDYNDKNLCGVRPMVKSGRIVGGKNSKFGEWPWQVLVRESTWLGLFTKNKCGGVLITNRFVTTAAHCQPGFLASLVAVFGENDISGDLEPRRPVSRNVRRVIVHRNYDAATFENDLAVLELETPIKFDAHIVPICMPEDEAEFTGRMATVTGWGRLKYGGGVPAVLQEVQVPVIENSVCQEMFQTAGHSKVILGSFLCAGYANGQKDSCEGDSGGPLVLQRPDGRWQLAGTVSHGIKCASPYLPGVYMRTTYYKPWLKSLTGVH